MSIQEVSAEQLAEFVYHYQQVLGPDFGCTKLVTGFMGRFANRGAEPRRSSGTFDPARTEVDDKRTERFQALLRQVGRSRVGLLNLALSAEGAAIAKLESQMSSTWSLRELLTRANHNAPKRVADHPDTP